ncbi:MAG: sulfite exporter TauE/SafE family protein [Actinomycetota bacterium]|nr:sulfite exporter TauE/SafE family protein [Actinomycetota bacterium]
MNDLSRRLLDAAGDLERDRNRRARRRTIAAASLSTAVTLVWLVSVTAAGLWPRVVDNWAASITMVAGSVVAGATPQGGGAVAFPVFTKAIEVPADVARTFSLCIQAVGMGTASAWIVIRRRAVHWRAVAIAAPTAAIGMVAGLVLLGRPDEPYWPSVLPGPYVKVTFTAVVVTMAAVSWLAYRRPLVEREVRLPLRSASSIGLVVGAALVGGLASSLVGSGSDVLLYLGIVVVLGLAPEVGVPTSVVVMATVSVVGLAVLGIGDGQLDVVVTDGEVLSVGGQEVTLMDGAPVAIDGSVGLVGEPGIPARRFDVFGLWIAAVPIVAWGAPIGAVIAGRLTDRMVVRVVVTLAVAELVTTIVFLDDVRTDPVLAAFGVALAAVLTGTCWAARRHRRRLFGVGGFTADRPMRGDSIDPSPAWGAGSEPGEPDRRIGEGPR